MAAAGWGSPERAARWRCRYERRLRSSRWFQSVGEGVEGIVDRRDRRAAVAGPVERDAECGDGGGHDETGIRRALRIESGPLRDRVDQRVLEVGVAGDI